MKKIKFIVTAACMLTSLCIQAVDVIEEGVDYYLLNAKTDMFLGGQNYWGTQATISEDAGIFRFVRGISGSGYNIQNTLVSVYNKNLGTILYTDTEGTMSVKYNESSGTAQIVDGIWEIRPQSNGLFAFYCPSEWTYSGGKWVETKHGYLTKSATPGYRKGYIAEFNETLTNEALFYVFTREEALTYMANKAKRGSVSFNFLIKNPDFCRWQSTYDWSVSYDCTNYNLSGGDDNNMCAESWRSTFTISQIVRDLPAGHYQLSAQGFYQRYEGTDAAPYIFAGDARVELPTISGNENSMVTASNSFQAGKYVIPPVRFNLDKTTDLEIGFHSSSNKFWCIWDNVQLMSYSDVGEYARKLFSEVIYPIQGLANTTKRQEYELAYNNLKTFVDNIIQDDGTTFDEVDEQFAEFAVAEESLKSSISVWKKYEVAANKAKKLYIQITSQEGIYKPNTSLDALNLYVNSSASAGMPGTTAYGYTFANGNSAYITENTSLDSEGINSEIVFLESLMNDVKKKSVQDGMDVSFLLVNPDFTESDGAGWNGVNDITAINGGLSGWPCAEAYEKASFDLYQVVENAPAGLYVISVNAFYRPAPNGSWTGQEDVPVEIYMGSISNPIQHISADPVVNDLSYNANSGRYENGTYAKNGTNVYFWDGNSAVTDADKESIWREGNLNEDEDVREIIRQSVSYTANGRYLPDYNWDGKLVPNGMDGASIAFSAGRYPMSVYGNVEDEGNGTGTLRIGIRSTGPIHWALWSNFRLKLLGILEEIKNMVRNRLETINSIETTYPELALETDELFNNNIQTYRAKVSAMLEDNSVTFDKYREAYDSLGVLIDNYYSYKNLTDEFRASQVTLANLLAGYEDMGDEVRAERKTFAANVYNVYEGLFTSRRLMRTQEDVSKDIQWVKEQTGETVSELTEASLPVAVEDVQNYVSTYTLYQTLCENAIAQLSIVEISPKLEDFQIGVRVGEEYLFDGTARDADVTGPDAYNWQVVYINEATGEESYNQVSAPGEWHVKIKALRSGAYHSAVFDNVTSFTIYKADEADMEALRQGYEASAAKSAWKTPWQFTSADNCAASLYGVTFTKGRVTAINLQENGITYVPAQWSALTELKTLTLDGNHIENVAVLPEGMDASGFSCKNQTVITPLSFNVSRMTAESIAASMPMSFLYDHGTQGLVNSISATLSGEPLNMVMYFTNTGGSWDLGYSTDQKVYRGQNGQHLTLTLQSGEAKGSTMDVTLSFDKGDANFTSGVDITDLQATVNFALDNYSSLFNFTAANLVEDDVINVQDIVCLVDILLSQNANARHIIQHRVAAVSEEDTDAHLYWDSGQLILETSEPVAAIDISMAGDADFTLLRQAGFTVASRGHRTIAYSMSGALLGVGATVIATADSESDVDDAVMANRNAARVSVDFNIDNVTGVSDIKNLSEDNNAHDFFDLNGRKLGKNADSPRGVYIIRDKATGKAEKRVNK